MVELERCDLHVTENSSVVIEAATLGRKSIFWDDGQVDAFDAEIRSGMALCRKPGQVAKSVREVLVGGATGGIGQVHGG